MSGRGLKSTRVIVVGLCASLGASPGISVRAEMPSAAASQALETAPGARAEGVESVESVEVIAVRRRRDHRISVVDDRFGTDRAAHVFLTLSDCDAPVSFTLGWFVRTRARNGEAFLDEFGERVPLPGQKPERAGFNRADWHAIRGFDLLSEGNLKAALVEFEGAAKLAPNSPKARNNLGACLAVIGEYGRAHAELNYAVKVKADYGVALANRALLALIMNQPDLAAADARRALKLQPSLKPAALAAGKAYVAAGALAEAKLVAAQLLKQFPSDPQVFVLAGDVAYAAGNLKEARQHYLRAVIFMPGSVAILLKLAHVAERLGDLDEALKRAREACQVGPSDPEAHFKLGRYLEMNRDSRAAQLQYERALALDPPDRVRVAILGPLLRVLVNTNRYEEADKLSRRAVGQYPESADCQYNRAWVAAQLPEGGRKKEAVTCYRKALALNNQLVQAHYNLAILLAGEGKTAEAATELRSFIEKAPQDPDVKSARELLARLGR